MKIDKLYIFINNALPDVVQKKREIIPYNKYDDKHCKTSFRYQIKVVEYVSYQTRREAAGWWVVGGVFYQLSNKM